MINGKTVMTIIPARGGSKRVPGKNIRLLAGKPLLQYSIEASIQSGVVDATFVSTDSDEIAEVARRCGAEVIIRPPELCVDTATSESALMHALDVLRSEGREPDIMVFLQATSPLRGPDVVKAVVEKLASEDYDSVISASTSYRYFGTLENGAYVSFRKVHMRSQEMNPWYYDTGATYAIFTPVFRKKNYRYGDRVGIVLMHEHDSFEIDHEDEFVFIEHLMKLKKGKH